VHAACCRYEMQHDTDLRKSYEYLQRKKKKILKFGSAAPLQAPELGKHA